MRQHPGIYLILLIRIYTIPEHFFYIRLLLQYLLFILKIIPDLITVDQHIKRKLRF